MGAASTLINTVIAEPPIALVADVTAPKTVIGPGQAFGTKCPRLQSQSWIIMCQRLASISPARSRSRRNVTTCIEHVWHGNRVIPLFTCLLPFLPCPIAKPEPVQTAFPCPVTVKTEIPMPVRTQSAVVMHLVFNVGSITP